MANDIPGVPSPTANEVGTPGGVPGLDLTKEVCANVTPNVKGDSRFAEYYLKYGNNFNKASRLACSVSAPADCISCVLITFLPVDAREFMACHRLSCTALPGSHRFAEMTVVCLQGDDSLFKSKFCLSYQAMSTIGFQFPADYAAVAANFILS